MFAQPGLALLAALLPLLGLCSHKAAHLHLWAYPVLPLAVLTQHSKYLSDFSFQCLPKWITISLRQRQRGLGGMLSIPIHGPSCWGNALGSAQLTPGMGSECSPFNSGLFFLLFFNGVWWVLHSLFWVFLPGQLFSQCLSGFGAQESWQVRRSRLEGLEVTS